MTNYYSKYLKYKKKYLMAKSNMQGGGEEQVDLKKLEIGSIGVTDAKKALEKLRIENRKIDVEKRRLKVDKMDGDDLANFKEKLDEIEDFIAWDAYISDDDVDNETKVIINFKEHGALLRTQKTEDKSPAEKPLTKEDLLREEQDRRWTGFS